MIDLKNLKITFLAGILGQGGAERQLFYILRALKKSGADTSLMAFTSGQYWENPIRELEVPFFFVGNDQSRLSRLRSIISTVRLLNPAILQSQHFYTNLYSAVAGHWLRVKDIGAIRSNGAYEVKQTGKVMGWLSLYAPKYLAANSIAGKKFAEKCGVPPRRLRLLPNVVDTNLFVPEQSKAVNRPVTMLIVSNLYLREKRVDLFVQAIGRLLKINQMPIAALIVGDGPLRNELELMAHEHGISDQLRFLGNTSTIEEVYKKVDVLVLTSDREGTPNVIMEAMASGLPVVATLVGGVADLVQDGQTGYLINAGHLEGLVEKLGILIENPQIRRQMGSSGREYVLAHHSLDQLPGILNNFYASIL